MTTSAIPGYRLGDPVLPKSPLTTADLATLKASLLFGEDDVAALRKAHDIVKDQVEAILDVWYGFVGSTPHLLAYFSDPKTNQPIGAYLDAVRKRFGRMDSRHLPGRLRRSLARLAGRDRSPSSSFGQEQDRRRRCGAAHSNAPRAGAGHAYLDYNEAVSRQEGTYGG